MLVGMLRKATEVVRLSKAHVIVKPHNRAPRSAINLGIRHPADSTGRM